jgi:hypothetical protein
LPKLKRILLAYMLVKSHISADNWALACDSYNAKFTALE